VRGAEVSNSEHEVGECPEEEEDGEGDAAADDGDEEYHRDHEPHDEVQAVSLVELAGSREAGADASHGKEDDSVRHPECGVDREYGSTPHIASRELPHTSEEHDETAEEEREPDDNIGSVHSAGVDVVQRPEEGGHREREDSSRSWVGDLGKVSLVGDGVVGSGSVALCGRHGPVGTVDTSTSLLVVGSSVGGSSSSHL